jgi:hypothetical protein
MSRKTSSTPTTACIRRGRTTGSSGYELGNVERRGGSARDRDTTGRHASDAEDQIMTRSEERLTVDTQRAGRQSPARQVRGHRAVAGEGPRQPRGSAPRARVDHRRQP